MNTLMIINSVGKHGVNQGSDVKIIRALLNCYLRTKSEATLIISDKNDVCLEQAIALFQKGYIGSSKPDSRVDANGLSHKKLKEYLNNIFEPFPITPPSYGLVTWESEGAEGGRYHSRKLHVPSSSSGLTIGRGYDCKRKPELQIYNDLISSGVEDKFATLLKHATNLSGTTAAQFIIDNDLLDFQVSAEIQEKLFKISYDLEKSEVQRICRKTQVEKIYGVTDWDSLNCAIKDITIDLKFRGDYTPSLRRIIQKHIAENNLSEFKQIIKDKNNWSNVPQDRFKRRSLFMDEI